MYTTWDYLTEKDKESIDKFLEIILPDINIYPVDFVKKSRLKAIAIVKNIAVQGQRRYAMPDGYGNADNCITSDKTLYLDISYLYSGAVYLRSAMHHEYYHLIEANFNGDFYYKDPKWAALNKSGTTYGSGGSDFIKNSKSSVEHPAPGFLSSYSMSGVEEDKANVFAALMCRDKYKIVLKYIKEDEILKAKFDYMKSFLKSLSLGFTDEYFDKIHEMN
jgi:hypothetical protein